MCWYRAICRTRTSLTGSSSTCACTCTCRRWSRCACTSTATGSCASRPVASRWRRARCATSSRTSQITQSTARTRRTARIRTSRRTAARATSGRCAASGISCANRDTTWTSSGRASRRSPSKPFWGPRMLCSQEYCWFTSVAVSFSVFVLVAQHWVYPQQSDEGLRQATLQRPWALRLRRDSRFKPHAVAPRSKHFSEVSRYYSCTSFWYNWMIPEFVQFLIQYQITEISLAGTCLHNVIV